MTTPVRRELVNRGKYLCIKGDIKDVNTHITTIKVLEF